MPMRRLVPYYWRGLAGMSDTKKTPNAQKSSRNQEPWIHRISTHQPLWGVASALAVLRFQVGHKWRALPFHCFSLLLTPIPAGVSRQHQIGLASTRHHKSSHPQAHPWKQLPPLPQLSERSHKAFWRQRPNTAFPRLQAEGFSMCLSKLSVADFFRTAPQSFPMLAGCRPEEKYFRDLPKLHSSSSWFICPKEFFKVTTDGKCFNGL